MKSQSTELKVASTDFDLFDLLVTKLSVDSRAASLVSALFRLNSDAISGQCALVT